MMRRARKRREKEKKRKENKAKMIFVNHRDSLPIISETTSPAALSPLERRFGLEKRILVS